MSIVIGLVIGGLVASVITYFITKQQLQPQLDAQRISFEEELKLKRLNAESEAEKLLDTARTEAQKVKTEADKAEERWRQELAKREERMDARSDKLDRQAKRFEAREQNLNRRQSRLDKKQNQMEEAESEQLAKLEEIANMTTDEAKQILLAEVEKEARQDMGRIMREIEDQAKETAETKARELIALAIQRVASDQVSEMTVSVVPLPNDEMKGRIIGRNGRNIRAFEQAAGVDIVVDDTPEAVTISSFDPVRREVARRSMAKLITDGRIHPARIEKLVKDAQKEVEHVIKEAGENAAYEANVHGLHPEVLRMLGRLKYRTSYSQNMLHHSVEASRLAAMIASELNANVEQAKMGALLHDIGKAMDHDQEGTHAMLGAEFLKRFKVPKVVINAVASHHHEVEQETVEAIIVEAADAISGARPGARRESLENYIKRVRTLEEIATSFPGVQGAYALQAGREIRVLVKPDSIDDLESMRLSKNIAKSIEDRMQYPGQIQVTVIRETRSVNFAK